MPSMLLDAFIDESGTHGDKSPLTVLGGYYSTPFGWQTLERAWEQLLSEHNLTGIHAKELFHRQKQYKHLTLTESQTLASKAYEIAQKNAIGFIVYLNNEDFNNTIGKHHDPNLDNKYAACFRQALSFLAQSVLQEHASGVRIFVEDGARGVGLIHRVHEDFKRLGDPLFNKLCLSVCKVTKKETIKNQAADLLVYSFFQRHCKKIDNNKKEKPTLLPSLYSDGSFHLTKVKREQMVQYLIGAQLLTRIKERYGKKRYKEIVRRVRPEHQGDLVLSPDPLLISKWLDGLPETQLAPFHSSQLQCMQNHSHENKDKNQ